MDEKTYWMATKDRKEEEEKTKTQMARQHVCGHSLDDTSAGQM